jgi:hypothetical protein
MTLFAHLIAALLVLFTGIHPSMNGPDPSWISGLYDDGDSDSLISTLTDRVIFKGALILNVPRVSHIPVFVGRMILSGVDTLPAAQFVVVAVRGPPLTLASTLASSTPPARSEDSSARAPPGTRPTEWMLKMISTTHEGSIPWEMTG